MFILLRRFISRLIHQNIYRIHFIASEKLVHDNPRAKFVLAIGDEIISRIVCALLFRVLGWG